MLENSGKEDTSHLNELGAGSLVVFPALEGSKHEGFWTKCVVKTATQTQRRRTEHLINMKAEKIKCKQTKNRKHGLIQTQFFEVKSLPVNYRMGKKENQKGWRGTPREQRIRTEKDHMERLG